MTLNVNLFREHFNEQARRTNKAFETSCCLSGAYSRAAEALLRESPSCENGFSIDQIKAVTQRITNGSQRSYPFVFELLTLHNYNAARLANANVPATPLAALVLGSGF